MKEIKRIALATDFSKSCIQATEYAKTLAKKWNATLVLLHVFRDQAPAIPASYSQMAKNESWYKTWVDETRESMETGAGEALEILARSCKSEGIACEVHLLKGKLVAQKIEKFIAENNIDLVVTGSQGSSSYEKFFGSGSVSNHVWQNTNCPVLVAK